MGIETTAWKIDTETDKWGICVGVSRGDWKDKPGVGGQTWMAEVIRDS